MFSSAVCLCGLCCPLDADLIMHVGDVMDFVLRVTCCYACLME